MHPYRLDLWQTWNNLVSKYSADESLVAGLYKELLDHYREPHRYYHNLGHIEALVQLYVQQEGALRKPDVVLFSIYYHDVIYTPGRGDNEHQSALLAGNALKQLGVPATTIEEVQGYIEATRNHKLPPDAEPDLQLFIDLDLSILAAGREEYVAYLHNVRKEYSYLTTEHFALGRRAFLQQMLTQPTIYYTESFRDKEEAARKNMQWELQMNPGIYSAR